MSFTCRFTYGRSYYVQDSIVNAISIFTPRLSLYFSEWTVEVERLSTSVYLPSPFYVSRDESIKAPYQPRCTSRWRTILSNYIG